MSENVFKVVGPNVFVPPRGDIDLTKDAIEPPSDKSKEFYGYLAAIEQNLLK